MKRPYKEHKLNITNKIEMSCGSMDSKFPLVIFINGRCWITPKSYFNYDEHIQDCLTSFKKKFKKLIRNKDNYENRFIFDFDIKIKTIKPNIKHFIDFQIFLKQNNDFYLDLKEIKNQMEDEILIEPINDLINDLENSNFIIEKDK